MIFWVNFFSRNYFLRCDAWDDSYLSLSTPILSMYEYPLGQKYILLQGFRFNFILNFRTDFKLVFLQNCSHKKSVVFVGVCYENSAYLPTPLPLPTI